MDIDDLRAFLTVAELRSFSQAAEVLHLTQPAVSKRIAALEARLESRLFNRIGRRVTLTEAGRILEPHARRVILELEDTRRSLHNLTGEVRGPLRVGASHHISLHRLPPALQAFVRRYPAVTLDLAFMDSEVACRAVERGDLELALVTLPPPGATGLTRLEVWTDRLVPAVGPDHPLRCERRITAAALARHPAILPARGTYTRALIEAALGPDQLETRMETHYLETIKMMVAAGLGWSLLPDTMVEPALRLAQVRGLRVLRQLGIVHHPQRTLSNAARAFIGTCREAGGRAHPPPHLKG